MICLLCINVCYSPQPLAPQPLTEGDSLDLPERVDVQIKAQMISVLLITSSSVYLWDLVKKSFRRIHGIHDARYGFICQLTEGSDGVWSSNSAGLQKPWQCPATIAVLATTPIQAGLVPKPDHATLLSFQHSFLPSLRFLCKECSDWRR